MRNKTVDGYRIYMENPVPYIVGVARPRAQRGENVVERQYKTEDEARVAFNAAQASPSDWPPVAIAPPRPKPEGDPDAHLGASHRYRADGTCRCGAERG